MKKKSSHSCPKCGSADIIEFKEYFFCKKCKEKYKKSEINEEGLDKFICPECGSLATVDIKTHVYCRECDKKYEKKKYFPYFRYEYYYCPRCGNKDLMEEKDRIYCEKCEKFFLKSSLRTMKEGEEDDVWSVRESMKYMSIFDPDKKGMDLLKDEKDNLEKD